MARHADRRVESHLAAFELLEQHVERHDFCHGSGMAKLVLVFAVENFIGVGINDECGEGRRIAGDHMRALALFLFLGGLGFHRGQRERENEANACQNCKRSAFLARHTHHHSLQPRPPGSGPSGPSPKNNSPAKLSERGYDRVNLGVSKGEFS